MPYRSGGFAQRVADGSLNSAALVALDRYLAVHAVLSELATATDLDTVLNRFVRLLRDMYPGDDASIFLVDGERLQIRRYARGHASLGYSLTELDIDGPGIVPDVVRTGTAQRLGDVRRDLRYVGALQGVEVRSELAVPLTAAGRTLGALNLESPLPDRYTALDERVVAGAGLHLAACLANLEQERQRRKTMLDMVTALSAMVEGKDDYTEGHCQRIAEMALAVGMRLGMDGTQLDRLANAALLHDIGKIAVPDAILNKAGPLTDEEFDVMKGHCTTGRRILEGIEFLRDEAQIVEQHHERFDGTGYPNGLAGDAIHLEARVISVVDAYDAMTTTRPYRQALPQNEALVRLQAGSGSQFDPHLVQVFMRTILKG